MGTRETIGDSIAEPPDDLERRLPDLIASVSPASRAVLPGAFVNRHTLRVLTAVELLRGELTTSTSVPNRRT